MFWMPCIVMYGSPEAASIADKMAARHARMTTAAVLVSDGLTKVVPTRVKFKAGICTVAMPNQQIVELHSTSVRFFDEIFGQVATTKPNKPLSIPDSAASVAVVHQEPLAWLVEAAQRKTFFNDIKRDPRWSVKGSELILIDPAKRLRSSVSFDTTFRVVEIKLIMNGRTVSDWKYRYVSEKDVPSIPTSAKVVPGLPARPALPSTTKSDAVILSQKVWRAVSRLDHRTIVQTNAEGTYSLSLKSTTIDETGPSGSWSLTGTRLTMQNKKGGRKTLQVKGSKFLDGLRENGIQASPIAWYILNRRVPYLEVFDHCDSISVMGSGTFGGKQLTILQIMRSSTRIRLYVDAKSGEISMISSDSQDAAGNVVNSSRLQISYR